MRFTFATSFAFEVEVNGKAAKTNAISIPAYVPRLPERGNQPKTSGPSTRAIMPARTAGGIKNFCIPFTLTLISLPRSISAEMIPKSTTIVQGVNVSIIYFPITFFIFWRKLLKRLSASALNFLTASRLNPFSANCFFSFSASAISLSSAFMTSGRISLRSLR